MKNTKPSIHIIALSSLGQGLSGGDRIYIELARRWSKTIPIKVYVWEEGLAMVQRQNLSGQMLKVNLIKVGEFSRLGFFIIYIYRIILGIKLGLTQKIDKGDYIYSASEFWMDSLAAFILKLRYQTVVWVAAWYQTAPDPFKGFAEGKREQAYRFRAFLYWFAQLPIKPLIAKCADYVLVNNQQEKKQFPKLLKNNKAVVVLGAVDTEAISHYIKTHKRIIDKKYTGVFQGRFHPQKGVVELIDIWKLVTKKIPHAKLAMIGDGPLMDDVKERIRRLGLEGNVILFGYQYDGDKKYSIFQSSKIVVLPSFYDSGGMAAAEAMAFGLPAVGFNLKAYSSYYPKGMIKVAVGDLKVFAMTILELNQNENLYNQLGQSAKEWIHSHFSWKKRANEIWSTLEQKEKLK